jgi:hypothetical protein
MPVTQVGLVDEACSEAMRLTGASRSGNCRVVGSTSSGLVVRSETDAQVSSQDTGQTAQHRKGRHRSTGFEAGDLRLFHPAAMAHNNSWAIT